MAKVGRPPQDPARQLERAHRILDAAAELILRWGYDKTTIDDVAQQAGVAKGTIYLHWKTRDALFAALLRRERVRMLGEVRAQAPATLRALLAELSATLLRRPLMKALLLGDAEVLGKLARHKRGGTGGPEQAAFQDYLGELDKRGALRTDRTPAEHLTILGSVVYGFLMAQSVLPEPARLPDDRLVELLADTGDRAMSTEGTPTDDDARAIAEATLDYLDTIEEIAQRKLAVSLGGDPAKERVT
ncbi:helix-turn-helix domain-containing protein [Nonomuraea sp. NPDC000554]|uniref:TetR/AcrR family transcriptional regulator n=1 Tax=Nonomuraea sp. NPDC000554 TaxID=3154259 RepID=UPI00332FD2D5